MEYISTEYIYVLSDPDSIKNKKYKIGITKRKKQHLLRDYRRGRPEVKLFLFQECNNSKVIETLILEKFDNLRINHESGAKSEWLRIDLNVLLDEIRKLTEVKEVTEMKEVKINNLSTDEYTVKKFIAECCTLSLYDSESCQDLYNAYIRAGINLKHCNKILFYVCIIDEITKYHGISKDLIRYKKNKLTYYKGIKIGITSYSSYSYCTIL